MTVDVEDDIAVPVTYSPERDRFLLLKRGADADVFPGRWDFPGGYLNEREDPEDAVMRELKEETGLLGTMMRTGEPHVVDTQYGKYRLHLFLVKVEGDDVDLSYQHVDYRWVEPSEVPEMETVKAIEKDFELVGVEI
ncbi:MAG: NUDIX domain-containing protein [Candidatus Nanohaloarchaea archaeon]